MKLSGAALDVVDLFQVTGFVVTVAAVDKRVLVLLDCLLANQATHGVVVFLATDFACCALDFLALGVALNLGDGFAVESHLGEQAQLVGRNSFNVLRNKPYVNSPVSNSIVACDKGESCGVFGGVRRLHEKMMSVDN